MSRVSMFNSPLLLGFDQLERTLDRVEERLLRGGVPVGAAQPASLRPAAVAIHDDAHVLGDVPRVEPL